MYYSVLLTCASFDLMPVLTALISRPRGPPNSSVVKVVQVVGLSGGPGLRFWIRIKFGSVLIQLFTWVRTNSEADRTIWDEPLVCLDISCLAISVSSLKQRKEMSNYFVKILMPCPFIGPKWFWTVQIVLVGSKLFWSGPHYFFVRFKLDFSRLIFIIWACP